MNKQITNVGQFDMNVSLLVLPCLRGILLLEQLVRGWGLLPTLRWVGSWIPTYLTSFSLLSREKISEHKSNHQPLHLKMGTSPLSPGCLGSSRPY